MKSSPKVKFFSNMCTAILFMVGISQLIYTDQYLELYAEQQAEEDQTFFRLTNKHGMTVGKKNVAGEKAWEYFQENYIPKMFKECGNRFYSINQYQQEIKIPCTDKWQWCLLRGPQYKYVPYYQIKAYERFAYYTELGKQDDQTLTVNLQLQAVPKGRSELIGLFSISIVMDYSYNVIDVYSNDGNKTAYPVFGNGHFPSMYPCQSLRSKNGADVEL